MKITNPMTPAQIINALDDVEISQAGLARDLDVSRTLIHLIIYDKASSSRVRAHIARAINRQVDEIWIIRKDSPTPGRPLTKGYFDHHPQAAAA